MMQTKGIIYSTDDGNGDGGDNNSLGKGKSRKKEKKKKITWHNEVKGKNINKIP